MTGTSVRETLRPPITQRAQDRFLGSVTYERLKSAGQMGALAARIPVLALRPPYPWWRDAVAEIGIGVRRSFVPLMLSDAVFLISFVIIIFGNVLTNLGVTERESQATILFWAREIGTWVTSMIFAGIVGASITADLGSRRIREELDALAVLGVDSKRELVVPRVVATTLAMPALVFISVLGVNILNYILAPALLGTFTRPLALYMVSHSILPIDLLFPMLIKNTIIGFGIGIVACHKGLTCKLGAEGVGRAVHQTVLICFFSIWMFNSFFNLAYLSVFPNAITIRG
jgi:phospholipid/cholesterol/gamma-HCH transport system permease protein